MASELPSDEIDDLIRELRDIREAHVAEHGGDPDMPVAIPNWTLLDRIVALLEKYDPDFEEIGEDDEDDLMEESQWPD